MKLYLSPCQRCEDKTPQMIYNINLRRGVKLRCSVCGKIKRRYYNLTRLEEVSQSCPDGQDKPKLNTEVQQ
jgi:hypothetical protein